jgi:uncharacterized membrane protein
LAFKFKLAQDSYFYCGNKTHTHSTLNQINFAAAGQAWTKWGMNIVVFYKIQILSSIPFFWNCHSVISPSKQENQLQPSIHRPFFALT